ncbi:hypothetical protein CPB97_009371, partial [Podila verticillata]
MTAALPLTSEASSSPAISPSISSLSQEQIQAQSDNAALTNNIAIMKLDNADPVVEAKSSNHAHSDGQDTTTPPYSAPMSVEEEAKLESAATLIQSAYRGYQTRRELYGPALTASQ